MDGNGRWGLRIKKSRNMGHKEGLNTIEKIIRETIKKKIRFLTLYAFSTENWKRPRNEINFLFNLLKDFLNKKTNQLNKNGIKFIMIGSKKLLSKKLSKFLLFIVIFSELIKILLSLLEKFFLLPIILNFIPFLFN